MNRIKKAGTTNGIAKHCSGLGRILKNALGERLIPWRSGAYIYIDESGRFSFPELSAQKFFCMRLETMAPCNRPWFREKLSTKT